ncbi:MAG: hypothetical protein H7Z72_09800 [Bacteroidetes bacterium]|nr:hypothetical protein [Fibrella sp.]
MKSALGTSGLNPELDTVRPHGMTRRQILEKLLNDPNPGLRGDAKWTALIEGSRLAGERADAKKASGSADTQP